MLRLSRIIVALVVFAMLTGVLVSYGMKAVHMGQFLARIQFVPAAFAFSLTYIVGWLIATLVFGRIYCSTVCPTGVLQDVIARLPRMGHVAEHRKYHYQQPLTTLRNSSLIITVGSVFLGISLITSLVDPYSIYSRFAVYCLKPLWGFVHNLFAETPVRMAAASVTGIAVSSVTVVIIGWLAWLRGRTFCNTVCPVGTTLGYISKYSIFHIDIDTDKCIQCRACEHVCKASCIDLVSHVVDSSRCVACFDCLPVCPNDAIHYTTTRHQLSIPLMRKVRNPLAGSTAGMESGQAPDVRMMDRRAFLAAGLVIAATPFAEAAKKNRRKLEGGLASGQRAVAPALAVTPPGIQDRQDFLDRCTGCGLCISHCMTKVLRPSVNEYGILRMFHPVKDYDRAYCAYTCTRCANVCPSGALKPLTREEKIHSAVGLARVWFEFCMSCGKCAGACPAGAIEMKRFENRGGRLFPSVDPSACIGCGACQFVCPATPRKAIIVNGLS